MSERSNLISKLKSDLETRASYIKAKLGVLAPSQIRALRLKSDMPRQADLAQASKMQQSRISMFETPGAANLTLETLSRIAAAFKVGVVVKFVPFSEMLDWENNFSQDQFNVVKLDNDRAFLNPQVVTSQAATLSFYRRPGARPVAWRHSGTVSIDYAIGDFSTVTDRNVQVVHNTSPQESIDPTFSMTFFSPQQVHMSTP